LFTLLGEDDTKNVVARLAKIKEVEKKILQVDGKYVLAKDLASTSRRDASIDGGVGHKQTSLLGIGLRSREKVEKAISTRKRRQ
jgi:flagellar motor switch protein FliG